MQKELKAAMGDIYQHIEIMRLHPEYYKIEWYIEGSKLFDRIKKEMYNEVIDRDKFKGLMQEMQFIKQLAD
jgi:hypothetical protein